MTDPTDVWRRNFSNLQVTLLESGVLDLQALRSRRRDVDVRETTRWVSAQGSQIIVVNAQGGRVYPSFQFTLAGGLRLELATFVAALQSAGYSPGVTWAWFVSPTSMLSGGVPAEMALTHPVRLVKAVRRMVSRAQGVGAF